MSRFLVLSILGAIAFVPAALCAQPSMTSASAVGVGAHGYDWMIGTWTCKNSVPSALAGPAIQTLTATRSDTGAIFWRYTGKNYDQVGFVSYVPATKTWWFSWAYPGGSHGDESTTQAGKKVFWTGSIFDASSGKTFKIRDTYTMYGLAKFNDLGEDNSSGSWKTGYNGTCTKA